MNPPPRIKNELGNKYGKLTVIGRDRNSGAKAKWVCKCDCGYIVSVIGYDLRAGKSKSCGCSKAINELGNRYGELVVIKYHKDRDRKSAGAYWICRCDCGNEISILGDRLRDGYVVSCGHDSILPAGESSFKKLLRTYKSGAKKRGLDFLLTEDEFRRISRERCYYCGDLPSNSFVESKYDQKYSYSGVDRVDSSLGYVIGNVVPCCKRCNWAKGKSPVGEFLEWMNRISDRRNNGFKFGSNWEDN